MRQNVYELWIEALEAGSEVIQENGKIDLNKAEGFFAHIRDTELPFTELIASIRFLNKSMK